ncbi:hypothetical protein JCM14635_00620 [Megalodesulfovibrio paquesii]
MQLSRGNIAGVLGLAVYFVFEYVCYWAGRAYAGMEQPIILMLGANMSGVLLGAVADWRTSVHGRSTGTGASDGQWPRAGVLVGVTAALLGAAACLAAQVQADQGRWLFILGAMFAGVQLPGVLRAFFQVVPRPRQGLAMGLALAAAEVFWIFLLARPGEAAGFPIGYYLAAIQLAMGGMVLLRSRAEVTAEPPHPTVGCPPQLLRKSLVYLLGIGVIFFLLDAFLDIIFFRYDKVDSPIPKEIGLYIWISYPLVGMLLDKKGLGVKIFLFFLACCIMSPGLTALSQSSPMYWVVFSLDIIGRHGAFLFLTIIAAHLANKFVWHGLMRCVPYLLQHASYLAAYWFVDIVHPGTACILLVSLFLCCTFSYLSLKIRYVVAISGYEDNRIDPPPMPKDPDCAGEAATGCVLTVTRLAWFVEKYGLTTRESDVMGLIMRGMNGQEMGQRLFISEHTIKSHIRNILRKTNTSSRSTLMALFINEKMPGSQRYTRPESVISEKAVVPQ